MVRAVAQLDERVRGSAVRLQSGHMCYRCVSDYLSGVGVFILAVVSCCPVSRFILALHRGLGSDPRALSTRQFVFHACNAMFVLAVDLFREFFSLPICV